MRKEKKKAVERELKRFRAAVKKDPAIKKKMMERELKRLRRLQREMMETEATIMVAVLRLQEDVYEYDDDGPGVEVLAGKPPKLKVVGDG